MAYYKGTKLVYEINAYHKSGELTRSGVELLVVTSSGLAFLARNSSCTAKRSPLAQAVIISPSSGTTLLIPKKPSSITESVRQSGNERNEKLVAKIWRPNSPERGSRALMEMLYVV
jgi:hypothetical protein